MLPDAPLVHCRSSVAVVNTSHICISCDVTSHPTATSFYWLTKENKTALTSNHAYWTAVRVYTGADIGGGVGGVMLPKLTAGHFFFTPFRFLYLIIFDLNFETVSQNHYMRALPPSIVGEPRDVTPLRISWRRR